MANVWDRRTMRTILKRVALILTLGVVAGMIYEKVGENRDQERFPRVGRAVDIGGRTLNIYCSGEGFLCASSGEPVPEMNHSVI